MRKCDCLDRCGDDPALQTKASRPCGRAKAAAKQAALDAELRELTKRLAHRWALDTLTHRGERVMRDGRIFFDMELPSRNLAAPEVRTAARYLLLAGLATTHPDRSTLLLQLIEA